MTLHLLVTECWASNLIFTFLNLSFGISKKGIIEAREVSGIQKHQQILALIITTITIIIMYYHYGHSYGKAAMKNISHQKKLQNFS